MQARALAALGRIEELDVVLDEIENAPELSSVRHALMWSPQILRAKGHFEAALQVAERAIDWHDAQRVRASTGTVSFAVPAATKSAWRRSTR